jgi:CheY-like chemotaxis protein
MKILVASKVGFIRHTLQRALKQEGHRVMTTDTPQKALQMVREDGQIDVVVADWAMSGMAATDICKAIRRIERVNDDGTTQAPYVIVLTNRVDPRDDDQGDREGELAAGFGEVLVKPVDPQILCQRARVIEAKRNPPPVQPATVPANSSVGGSANDPGDTP